MNKRDIIAEVLPNGIAVVIALVPYADSNTHVFDKMVLPFKASGIGILTVLRPVVLPKSIAVLVAFIVLSNLPFNSSKSLL